MSVKLNIDAKFLLKEEKYPDGFTFEAKGKTVGECLNQYLATKPCLKKEFFNRWGCLDTNIGVIVNNQVINSDQLNKEVQDGDQVKIMCNHFQGC